jgi:hypothetical protein
MQAVSDCCVCDAARVRRYVTRQELELILHCVTRTEEFLEFLFSQHFFCTECIRRHEFLCEPSRQVSDVQAK